MTFLHVVLGEVVPKNLAMDRADRLALLVRTSSAHLLPDHRAVRVDHRTRRRFDLSNSWVTKNRVG